MANIYKDTLLIGNTEFGMRADLKTKEPVIQELWKIKDIYKKRLAKNEGKELFMLHDGPPYANGNLHIGHALNKSLKDFIIRWKNSNGYNAPFIMGWDTHGLPIENAVTKTGVDRKSMSPDEFRELCRKYALDQVANQSNQFARLGMFTDYETNYLTLYPEFEISELRLFERMYNEGLIYKALKPIYWSPSSESALAESEIEYQDIKSPTVYVAVDLKDNELLPNGTQTIIWTTTPWTLPTNQLIAVGERMEYSLVNGTKDGKEFNYVVATDLLNKLTEILEWENVNVVKTFKGADLVGIKYVNPLYKGVVSEIVAGHHVTAEAGTGLVHIAGGFGEDDYLIAKNFGLEPFAPIDNQGKFTEEVKDEELIGKFYDDTNKIITTRLSETGNLLKLKFVTHSYPHDWRTKKPVIYRATLQWFVGLNKAKDQILEHVNNITTHPKWAKQRLYQVLDDRTDWTISRQRLWGVPIIGFYDQNDELILDKEILNYAITKIEELGTNAWFSEPADTFLPEQYRNKNIRKEKDILDVWFDSGSSAIALENRFPEFKRPYDVYLEGNDQYRGWFNASMINSVVYDNKSPYKHLISHGMTTDEKGRKMSKSLGNGIDPIDFSNNQGADVLRLWVASTDYTDDQRIGDEIIKQVSESYRKIRNTIRFILGNLFDFDADKNYQNNLESVDRYALSELTKFKNKVAESYENYKFNDVYNTVVNYVTKDLSSFYLDFIKDIVYVEAEDSIRRRQVQTVLFEILWALIDALRPIIPHTIEETYQNLTSIKNKEESVHLLDVREQKFELSLEEQELWDSIMELRNDVNKALEIAREAKIINKGFEAKVEVSLKSGFEKIKEVNDLSTIFIVSKIEFVEDINNDAVDGKIALVKASLRDGEKCERCWGIYDKTNNGLCERCSEVVNNLKK